MKVISFFKPLNVFLFIVTLIQITNLKINFFPRNLVLITFFLGIVFFIVKMYKDKKVDKSIFWGLILLLIPGIFLLLSILTNQYFDFDFLKEIIIFNFVVFVSAYGIVSLCKSKEPVNFFTWLIGLSVVFQLVFSLILFLIPSGFQIAAIIFELTQDADKAIQLNEFRMVGVGAGFFQSGILNSFALVMISSLIISPKTNNKEKNILYLFIILISVLGLFSSRSTIIGILISLLLIVFNIYKSRVVIYSSILMVLLLLVLMPIINNLFGNSRLFDLFKFGTQFIFDFNNSQASQSTGELNDMWEIWPNSLKTWLIGDAKYRDGTLYYMHTDVGYARIVYAIGFFGLISVLIGQIYLILKLDRTYFNFQAKICMLVVLLICEIKGVTLFTPFLSILFLASRMSKKNKLI